jgi:hypothetical protein
MGTMEHFLALTSMPTLEEVVELNRSAIAKSRLDRLRAPIESGDRERDDDA